MLDHNHAFLVIVHWIVVDKLLSLDGHCLCVTKERSCLPLVMHTMLSPDTRNPSPTPTQPPLHATYHLQQLPPEILNAIFDKLSSRTLIQLTSFNRHLRHLILNGPSLWREFHWADLDEGMLSEGFASFAEKYFKDGALLQHVNLDFADTQLREDEELEEIDLVFDFLQEYHCTQVQSCKYGY